LAWTVDPEAAEQCGQRIFEPMSCPNGFINARPRVSVVVAAFNCREWLGDCLASLQSQTFADWEAVVCDDASDDGTWELLQMWAAGDSRLRPLRNQRNLGAGATRNRCLAEARGEFVAIQDADDVSQSERLGTLVGFLDQNPDCAYVGTGLFLYDHMGTYGNQIPKREEPRKRDFLWGIPYGHATTMFRRTALQAVGGYRVARETLRGQDYDLFMRLHAAGHIGKNLPLCLYGYRAGRDAYRRRKFRYRIDEMIIRFKGFRLLGLLPWAIPFVFKPLLVAAIPSGWLRRGKSQIARPRQYTR
jgi:glycosyltransferase EpsE